MKILARTMLTGLMISLIAGIEPARANDNLFPELPAATKNITFKDGFFSINGKPTFLVSGEIHYARVPRALWRDRLIRSKRMGINCIQTYIFWNAQEPVEGKFDDSDNRDLDAWLSLIQELGMYAVVRPGPYNCAEWESGGIPAWLTTKPKMEIRNSYPEYLIYVDKYYEHILPIIVKHQINRGGSVVLMQIENEHPAGWGTDGNDYLKHLHEKAVALGLEVPSFYSGLHHGFDPAGNQPFGERTSPWHSTEFWTGWFDGGGERNENDIRYMTYNSWKIIAYGGAGYDYYVVHGGTNFGYTSDDELPTSYDYKAAIGEEGQLRKLYYSLKKPCTFANSFSDILSNAKEDKSRDAQVAKGLRVHIRKSSLGTIVFVENPTKSDINTTLTMSSPDVKIPSNGAEFTVPEQGMKAFLVDLVSSGGNEKLTIASDVLEKIKLGLNTYYICYGEAGKQGSASCTSTSSSNSNGQSAASSANSQISFTYPQGDTIQQLKLSTKASTSNSDNTKNNGTNILLVMNTSLAERAWITDKAVVIGPRYLHEDMSMEAPAQGGKAIIITESGQKTIELPASTLAVNPTIAAWKWRDGAAEAAKTFSDSTWASSGQPEPMTFYNGYQNGYGWYRTTIKSNTAKEETYTIGGIADRAYLFVNGKRTGEVNGSSITIPLVAGDNSVALLAAQNGRNKVFNFTGTTGTVGYKGIWGPVQSTAGAITLNDWRMDFNNKTTNDAASYAAPNFNDTSWKKVQPTADLMEHKTGDAWFRADFTSPQINSGSSWLYLNGIDDFATVFLNGEKLGTHDDYRTAARFSIDKQIKPGKNVIAIAIHNKDGAGGLTKPVNLLLGAKEIAGSSWRFHPSPAGIQEKELSGDAVNMDQIMSGAWSSDKAPGTEWPRLWQSTATVNKPANAFSSYGLRTKGLSRGVVWFNGHNLGLYKNEELLYVPECWINPTNTLVVFDELGSSPASVTLENIEVHNKITK